MSAEFDPSEMSIVEKVAYVKSTVGPLDLVDMLELEATAQSKIRSPWNQDERTPSCQLYEDHFYDFSTGKGGDVIDLYQLLAGISWGSALHRLASGAARLDADPDRIKRSAPEVLDLTEQWRAILWAPLAQFEVEQYLKGITVSMVRLAEADDHLRFDGRQIHLAHWHDGVVRGIKIRALSGAKSAVTGSAFGVGLYSPCDQTSMPFQHRRAVIVEGESDSLSLKPFAVDSDVFALPCGAGVWRDAWLPQLERYDTIYTCFDNDDAGKRATAKVRSAIGWGRWKELRVPPLFNDVREAVAAGWRPSL